MKRILHWMVAVVMVAFVCSCNKTDYRMFIGTWGVEQLEYWHYNVDYAGNPIAASYEHETTYEYEANNPDYGIQLVFNENKTGAYRDFAIDSIWFKWNENTQDYDTYLAPPSSGYDSVIYCPDTVLVSNFTYTYDEDTKALYMNMDYLNTYMMTIVENTSDELVLEHRYSLDQAAHLEKLERFRMKRVSNAPKSSRGASSQHHPVPQLSRELFDGQH